MKFRIPPVLWPFLTILSPLIFPVLIRKNRIHVILYSGRLKNPMNRHGIVHGGKDDQGGMLNAQ